MNTKRFTLCILSLMLVCICSIAQSQPDWTKGTGFKSLTYSDLIVKSAVAQTSEQAEILALNKVKQEADGRNYVIVDKYTQKSNNSCTVYVLAQITLIAGHNVFEQLEKTNRYNLIGESFVPGMAQIKKGQTVKGACFITAEALCIGGIIMSECQRSSYINKINDTRNPSLMKEYKNKSNDWATARNIFIAGAAAVYVWNVIDGIVAKGKTQILGPDGKRIAFAPYYTPSTYQAPESFGLAVNITW